MKNIITKLVIMVALLANVVSIDAMGRAVRPLNRSTKAKTVLRLGGRKATENYQEKMIVDAKNGKSPSKEELAILSDYSLHNSHGPLNFADNDGHSLLFYVLKNNFNRQRTDSDKELLEELYESGAELNPYDKNTLKKENAQEWLKVRLNLPYTASAKTISNYARMHYARSFLKREQRRVANYDEISRQMYQEKLADVSIAYNHTKKELSVQAAQDRLQAKKDLVQAQRDSRMPE
jgi:hypothetical protein